MLPNLGYLIIFVLCSNINSSMSQKDSDFSLITGETSNTANVRLMYVRYGYRITTLKLNFTEVTLGNKPNQLIEGLEACTTYTLEAKLQNENKDYEFIQKQNFTTTGASPKTEIEKIIPSSYSVNVSLRYENVNCINSVKYVVYNGYNILFDKTHTHSTNYIHIDQLTPCTNYKLIIRTQSRITGKTTSDNKDFTTDSVTNISIENIKFDDVQELLSWDRPSSGQECIKNYKINILSDFHSNTETPNKESLYLTEPGCSNLNISITPKGVNGTDLGKPSTKNIQIGIKEPGEMKNLIGTSSSNSITISWNSPNENPLCVKKYAIKYSGKSGGFADKPPHTIDNLESCLEYNIQACLLTKNDKIGKCESVNVTTAMGIPGKVTEIRTSFSTSTRIDWKPPISGAKCVAGYAIMIYDEFSNEIYSRRETSLHHQIDNGGLKSCQNYTAFVTSLNANNEAGAAGPITLTTQPTKPSPPTMPLELSKTATSLMLQSEYKMENDYCPLKAAIFKCQEKRTNFVQSTKIELIHNERIFTATVDNLADNTEYECSVSVENELYQSEYSKPKLLETRELLPDPPEITIISSKHASFILGWTKLEPRIKITHYHVKVIKLGKNYNTPDGCEDNLELDNNGLYQIDSKLLQYEITNLEPYTNYTVQMAIENTAGFGNYSDPIDVITKPYTPHQVTKLDIVKMVVGENLEVKPSLPCQINGQLVAMVGTLYESGETTELTEFSSEVTDGILPTYYMIEYKLKAEKSYNITIGLKLADFPGSKNETSFTFNTTAGIPDAYNSSDWGWLEDETSPPDNTTLFISQRLFSPTTGKILRFTLLISEHGCLDDEPTPKQLFCVNEVKYKSLPTWNDVAKDECTRQYQLEQFTNDYNFSEIENVSFTIGNETCDTETTILNEPIFCNGRLKPGTAYAVMARVFTSNGFADTQPKYITTSQDHSSLIVILIISSILLVGFFFGIGYMRFKVKYLNLPLSVTDITVKSYLAFYSNMEFDLIVKEYESITTLDLREFTTNEAKKYREKNRYANILPYDQNRVFLTPSTYCTSDYINASYIDGYKRKREYIASQGPKQETSYDFWDMVIETKCHKIIMLTKLVENDITKCFQYYPDANTDLWFNDIKITNIKEDDLEIFTRREIKITKGIAKRIIVQYHFQKWPDHDCPENEMDLIKFIKFFKSDKKTPHPVVVHCSAGVGRTGTLIALDVLMQQVQRDKHLNIFETVKKLRHQRVKMVQTFEQYEFLYKSVAKYIQWKWPTTKRE